MKTYYATLLAVLVCIAATSVDASNANRHDSAQARPIETEWPIEPGLSAEPDSGGPHARPPKQDRVVWGGQIVITEDSRGDIVSGLGSVTVEAPHEGDVVILFGRLHLNANLSGDVVILGGHLEIAPGIVIHGDLVQVAGSSIIPPDAHVTGNRVSLNFIPEAAAPAFGKLLTHLGEWIGFGPMLGRPIAHQLPWNWAVAGIFTFIYMVLALAFPSGIADSVSRLKHRPLASLLTGVLFLVLLQPLGFLLVVSVIGIPVFPFLLLFTCAIALFGKAALLYHMGSGVLSKSDAVTVGRTVAAILMGAAAVSLLYIIPVLGILAWLLLTSVGLGTVLLGLFERLQRETGRGGGDPVPYPGKPETQPAAAATLGVPASDPQASPPPVESAPPTQMTAPITAPRAGFWIRFAATLIDLILVGILAGLLGLGQGFIGLWLIYHVGMWTWKGTTLGGIVFRLQIVRTNGQRPDFAVCLVRSLTSVLSFLALGLGFFWAGWSQTRQSWHDSIAGTVIVKVPEGTSML